MTGDNERGTGRTLEMVKSLPPDGRCIVVVHRADFAWYVRDMIANVHNIDCAKKVKIVSLAHAARYLRGISIPIFMDHYVAEYAYRGSSRDMRDYADVREEMYRAEIRLGMVKA